MEIKNFIKIYDDVLPLSIIGNIIRYAKTKEFQETKVGGEDKARVDFNTRRTYAHSLTNISNSLSTAHWFNFLQNTFMTKIKQYAIDCGMSDPVINSILNIEILKYEDSGFYTWHTDHFSSSPRTLSCILLLNNDYEGGNLCFRNPDKTKEWEVDIKSGRLIIWPSNFLYPHTVKPVTKGTRYSVVSWAL